MRIRFVVPLIVVFLLSWSVRADQVTLKNGDRISGSIVKTSDDAKTLLIKSELAGDVTVPFDAVTGIVSSQPLNITLSDGRVIVGTVTTTDGKMEVSPHRNVKIGAPGCSH